MGLQKRLLFFFLPAAVVFSWVTVLFLFKLSKSLSPLPPDIPSHPRLESDDADYLLKLRQELANRSRQSRKVKHYPNISVEVNFKPASNWPSPYTDTNCAPGLTCVFSDQSWHERKDPDGWNNNLVVFPQGAKKRNSLAISLESPGHHGHRKYQGKHDGHAGIATTNLDSDVPIAYSRFESIYQARSAKIKTWKVLHLSSNCNNIQSNRNHLAERLSERGILDSYGRCQHNIDFNSTHKFPPPGRVGKEGLMEQYAFVTAFENSYYPGYITEKLWDALAAGTVPLYLGAPNAKVLFPKNSFIDVNSFESYDHLIDYIEYLVENKDFYEGHHAWRKQPIPSELQKVWHFADDDENCRLCRWGAENIVLPQLESKAKEHQNNTETADLRVRQGKRAAPSDASGNPDGKAGARSAGSRAGSAGAAAAAALSAKVHFRTYGNGKFEGEHKNNTDLSDENPPAEIHFRTFGTAEYAKAKARILSEANASGWFKTVEGWSMEDLPENFRTKYNDVLALPRGGGYWIWKYAIFEATFAQMREGDFLVYSDSGSSINGKAENRFNEYIKDLQDSPFGVQCQQLAHPEHKYTSERIFQTLHIAKDNSDIRDSGMYTSPLLFQKNDHSRLFLKRVFSVLEKDPFVITDKYNEEAKMEDNRFVDNRHDQSLSSVILKTIGCVVYADETWPPGQLDKPFWASRLK